MRVLERVGKGEECDEIGAITKPADRANYRGVRLESGLVLDPVPRIIRPIQFRT